MYIVCMLYLIPVMPLPCVTNRHVGRRIEMKVVLQLQEKFTCITIKTKYQLYAHIHVVLSEQLLVLICHLPLPHSLTHHLPLPHSPTHHLPLPHSLTISLSHTHPLTISLSHTHSASPSPTLTHSPTHHLPLPHSLSISLSHTHSPAPGCPVPPHCPDSPPQTPAGGQTARPAHA